MPLAGPEPAGSHRCRGFEQFLPHLLDHAGVIPMHPQQAVVSASRNLGFPEAGLYAEGVQPTIRGGQRGSASGEVVEKKRIGCR